MRFKQKRQEGRKQKGIVEQENKEIAGTEELGKKKKMEIRKWSMKNEKVKKREWRKRKKQRQENDILECGRIKETGH